MGKTRKRIIAAAGATALAAGVVAGASAATVDHGQKLPTTQHSVQAASSTPETSSSPPIMFHG